MPTGRSGNRSSGPDLGRVERIEVELRVLAVFHDLDLKLPLREVAPRDGVVQVLGGVIEVRGLDLLGLGQGQVLLALLGDPVILHQDGLALRVHPLVGVDARAVHVAVVRPGCPTG